MNLETLVSDIPLSVAENAYRGVSFTPERRGQSERAGYAAQLAEDYAHFCKMISGEKAVLAPLLEEEFARYREGYRSRLLKKLHSDSRCISWMITGPSNFPTRRNEKRNNVAHKRLEELLEFRQRALAAITKKLCPELRPIMAGDSDALESLQKKIAGEEALLAGYHAVNKAHKAFLKDPATLDAAPFPEERKKLIRDYKPRYSWEPHPIAPFEFTNLSANIRRLKKRLESLTEAKATPASETEGTLARLEDCPADNRVRLFFPGKPAADVRERLKHAGFRWSPTLGCWQAYRNSSTAETARKEAGL